MVVYQPAHQPISLDIDKPHPREGIGNDTLDLIKKKEGFILFNHFSR
jgi:hypothetical protein